MKNIFPFVCTALIAVGFVTSCGSDDDSATNISETTSYDARHNIVNSNKLEENGLITFSQDLTSATARFAANNSENMRLAMVLAGTNGKKIAEYPALFSEIDKMYHVNLTNLSPGNIYFYHIVAYDADGNYVSRANEGSFTLPQLDGPAALTGLVAHAPTDIAFAYNNGGTLAGYPTGYITGDAITPAVEYSTNGGEDWESATSYGIIEYLPIGKVLVRIAATTSRMAGASVELTIPGNTDINGEGGYAEGENARQASLTR